MEAIMNQSALQGQTQQNALANAQQQYYLDERERGLAETQLDVTEIISKIYHLLQQDVWREDDQGIGSWKPVKPVERTLTDWGVDRIMQVTNFYVNKNNLLSNYDEKQINRLMLRFVKEINDLVLLKYQLLFRQPTFEECKTILLDRIEGKKQLKMFAYEILGKIPNEKEIKAELVNEVEHKLEKEIEKIRNEQRKEKIREYGILMAQLETMVYATFNRAWRGEERGSIRRHTNISEVIGKMQSPQQKGGMFKWVGI